MTAAATDGSRYGVTSVTLAVFDSPDWSSPAIAANRAEITYSTTRTCHERTPDRRAATGLSPIAYSIRP